MKTTGTTIDPNRVGAFGERLAARYLFFHGYKILERNYRAHRHELDIIALRRRDRRLCFVEVKTRSQGSYGRPAEYVTREKQRFLKLAAQSYLQSTAIKYSSISFDIIEVRLPEKSIEHLEAAFE